MRPLASLLVEETDLTKYQVAYTAENQKMPTPAYKTADRILPIRKHTFAPDIDPSTLIGDEVVFKALTGINWATSDFQPMGEQEEEESVQDDPETSTRQDQGN